MQSLLREAMAEGAFGLSSGLDYPPGAYATTAELAALTARGRPPRRLLPHPRPLSARATATSTRSARRSRSVGGPGRRPTSPTSTIGPASRAAPSRCSSWSIEARAAGQDVTFDSYPSEWASTRLLILIPPWVQEGGPAPDEGAPRRPDGPRADPARAAARAGTLFARQRRPGRRAGRLLRPARARPLGRLDPRPDPGRDRAPRRSTSCATCSWRRTSA